MRSSRCLSTGTNLYAAARGLGLEIDFRKLIQEFRKRGRLLRVNYYTTITETDDHNPVRPLVDWLSYNGFNTIVKNAKEYTDREGRRRFRGSMDIELVTDMLELAPTLDHVVLFAGNGDFRRAVEAVKAKGVASYRHLVSQITAASDRGRTSPGVGCLHRSRRNVRSDRKAPKGVRP